MKKIWIVLLSVCLGLFLVGGGMYVAAVAMGADGYTADVGGLTISATPRGFHIDARRSVSSTTVPSSTPDEPQSLPASQPAGNSAAPAALTRVEAELHLYDLEVTVGRELDVWAENRNRQGAIAWEVADGILTIREEWEEDWTNWRNWTHFDDDDLTVHLVLPQEGLEGLTLSVSSDYGDLDFEGLQAGQITAELGAGEIDFERCALDVLEVRLGAGELKAEHSVFRDSVSAENGAGDIELENCEIGTASLTLGFGDVEVSGSLSGELSAETGGGDITVQLSGAEEDYSYDLSSSMGEVRFNGYSSAGSYVQTGEGPLVRAESGMGDVRVSVGR